MLHTHNLSSGACTKGQIVADVPSGLNLSLTQENHTALYIISFLFTQQNITLLVSSILTLIIHAR
jgi:hypothetical protein